VFQKAFLQTLSPTLMYAQDGKSVDMPERSGDTVKWRRLSRITAQTTPLDEINDPTAIMLNKTDISATVKQYGFWTAVSEWHNFVGLGEDEKEIVNELRKARDLTIDTLCRNVLVGSASSSTCDSGTGTATLLNKTDINQVVQTMLTNNCELMSTPIKAGTGVGTLPISDAFKAIAHTAAWTTLQEVDGFVHVKNYASTSSLYPGEVGSTGMVRWCLTSNGYYDGSTYYYATILSRGAFGTIKLSGNDEPLIYKTPQECPSPLNLYGTIGTKFTYATKILDEIRIHNLRFTV
jgi:N4-gp56 family major capsid protein